MTAKKAYATAFVFIIAADKKVGKWEPVKLKAALKGIVDDDEISEFIKQCIEYANKNSLETFVQESAQVLNGKQRLCLLLNLLDSISSNGKIAVDDEVVFRIISKAYRFGKKELKDYEEMISIKNDKSTF